MPQKKKKRKRVWIITFTPKALGQFGDLNKKVRNAAKSLIRDMELEGPERHNWPNYSKLRGKENQHHCHLKKGKAPTYVAVWEVIDEQIKHIEVIYVGTHEKAPY